MNAERYIFQNMIIKNSENIWELLKTSMDINLMKKHTGLTNRKVGELIGGISYAAVSKA